VRGSTVGTFRGPSGRFPLFIYLGGIFLLAAIGTGGLVARAKADASPSWILAVVGILASLCASQLAVSLVNWLATVLTTPHLLPRMDYSNGIPPRSRTLVVIPTMLSSAAELADLVEALEVRFLANRDENLPFALLTDLSDAAQETLPEDEALRSTAAPTGSFSSIGHAASTRAIGSGWATNASAANSRL